MIDENRLEEDYFLKEIVLILSKQSKLIVKERDFINQTCFNSYIKFEEKYMKQEIEKSPEK